MGRSSDERLTREVGREICQRQGLKAYIAGTIASLGTAYVLTLEAVNAQTGEVEQSRKAYEDFLESWRDADAKMSLSAAAKSECERLT